MKKTKTIRDGDIGALLWRIIRCAQSGQNLVTLDTSPHLR